MSQLNKESPQGILRNGWKAAVDEYAIAGDWACGGSLLVVGDAAGGIFGFESESGTIRWKHSEAHPTGLLALAVQNAPGTHFATGGQDGQVRIWDAQEGTLIQTIEFGSGWVEHLAWSLDGQHLAASLSRRVHVFNLKGEEIWQSEDHPSTVSAVAWACTGELATACYGRVSFFEGATGQLNQKLEWKGSLVSLALSSDGNIVACGSQDKTVHFWRRSTAEDSEMCGYPEKPASLAFDDSNTLLATGGGETVTVWSFEGDGPEGTAPGFLELHVQSITSLTFAQGKRRLASGARDGAVIVWDLQTNGSGEPVGAAFVDEVISRLMWRPDGRGLASLDAQGGVTTWRVSN